MSSREHYEVDVVQRQIARAVDAVCADARRCIRTQLDIFRARATDLPPLESPMEAVFEAWWDALYLTAGDDVRLLELIRQHVVTCPSGAVYRLDFAIFRRARALVVAPPIATQIGVEIDGHVWHERTPEQVTRRNQRDRHLHDAGWRLFHFSGAELLRDPKACIDVVQGAAARLVLDAAGEGA